MKKRTTSASMKPSRKSKKDHKSRPSREFIRSLRGKYKGSGLMEELMEEKKREREL